jgi:hypothetical protein
MMGGLLSNTIRLKPNPSLYSTHPNIAARITGLFILNYPAILTGGTINLLYVFPPNSMP